MATEESRCEFLARKQRNLMRLTVMLGIYDSRRKCHNANNPTVIFSMYSNEPLQYVLARIMRREANS